MSTITMLSVLRTDVVQYDEVEGPGTRGLVMRRPANTPLRNDGVFRHWMAADETYRVAWDGTGWRVTCATWESGHVYRLADLDFQFVSTLPIEGGTVELEPGRAYEIRETEPTIWALFQI